jgi:hypothetical protein
VNKNVDGQRNVKPKRRTKGKVATERVQMGKSRSKKRKEIGKSYRGIITGVKFGIKENRQEKKKDAWKEKFIQAINGGK